MYRTYKGMSNASNFACSEGSGLGIQIWQEENRSRMDLMFRKGTGTKKAG